MLIDIHCHTHNKRNEGVRRFGDGKCWPSPKELISMMDKVGIDKAVLHGCVSPERRWTLVIPEEVMQIAQMYPDRFIPFCNVDPRYLANDTTSDFIPILSAYKEMGFKGVGEYFPNIPLDDPLNVNLFKQIEEIGLPLTFHLASQIGGMYGCFEELGLPRLERVLKECPDLVFLAHSQVFWSEIGSDVTEETRSGYPTGKVNPGRVVELMREYPNLHGDLSAGSGLNAISRDIEFGCLFMEEFQDRLYFGTDIATNGQKLPQIDFFNRLKNEKLISQQTHDKITWKNAVELLNLKISGD